MFCTIGYIIIVFLTNSNTQEGKSMKALNLKLICILLFLIFTFQVFAQEREKEKVLGNVEIEATKEKATNGLPWIRDYDKALALAKETGRPMLIDFMADWCGPCKEMEATFWMRQEVMAERANFIFVKVDTDRNPVIAAKYNANVLPNVLFTDPWGNPLINHVGFSPARASIILTSMKAAPKDYSEATDFGLALEKNSKDLDATIKLSEFYNRKGFLFLAKEYAKKALSNKLMEQDSGRKENMLNFVGIASLKLGEFDDAKIYFEKYLKEFPDGKQGEVANYGMIMVNLKKNKIADAEKYLTKLKSRFPESKLIEKAEKNIELAKQAK